jgi:8-oxo-dGTP pyrophosphatase MutT (NUDIX family)
VVGLLTNYFDAEGNQIQNPTFLLTLRSSNLSSHASQVALPGGLVDPEDELNSIVTLTREFEEEVGISPRKVEWLPKSLGFALSRNGLNVECRVGTVLEPIEILKLDEKEVSEAAWVPMDLLVNSDFWGYRDFLVQKSHAEWQTVPLPYWTGWTYSVWGLTGGFLRRFVRTFHPEFF